MSPRAKLKPLKPGRTEKQVLSQVIEAAKMLGLDLDRQNTGGASNAKGRLVMFGKVGNSDLTGMLPDGRKLDVEVKREHWDPAKARGKTAERWAAQLDRLHKTNAQGGVGFWTDNVAHFLTVMRAVLDGARVIESGDTRGPRVEASGPRTTPYLTANERDTTA